MIAYLHGKLALLEPTHTIIECGGIGYLVKISLNTYNKIKGKTEIKLFTYFQVREDAQILFGFAAPQEQQLFEQLISISGVGGNTAMTILSSISPNDLYQAIIDEDTASLKRVKGIGAKTAGRIILELKDKIDLGNLTPSGKAPQGSSNHKKQEAAAALVQLGFPRPLVNKRLDAILKAEGEDISTEDLIKKALKNP